MEERRRHDADRKLTLLLNATSFLGSSGVGSTSYEVYFLPVGTTERQMRGHKYKIGMARTLEKAITERHFTKR